MYGIEDGSVAVWATNRKFKTFDHVPMRPIFRAWRNQDESDSYHIQAVFVKETKTNHGTDWSDQTMEVRIVNNASADESTMRRLLDHWLL